RIGLLLASIAAQRGSDAAIARSLEVTNDEKARMDAIQNAGSLLLELHLYPQAADMLSKVNTGDATLEVLEAIRKTKPYSELKVEGNDAVAEFKRFLIGTIGPDEPDKELISRILPVPVGKTEKRKEDPRLGDLKLFNRGLRNLVVSDIPSEARGDILLSNMKVYSEGNDADGYRMTLESFGASGLAFYAVKTQQGYRFVSPNEQSQAIARIAREKARGGDLKTARMWLDWQREEVNAEQSDDPLDGTTFTRFWKKGQNGDNATVELAVAALLADSSEDEESSKILSTAYANAKTDQEKVNIDLATLRQYLRQQNFDAALPSAERLFKAHSDSPFAFRIYYYSLAETKRYDEAEKLVNERIAKDSKDLDTFELISDSAERRGDFKKALSLLAPVLQQPKPRASLLNKYAWTALFLSSLPPDAVEAAQRANRLSDNKDFSIIHTLACVYAEIGRNGEAQKLLLQAMDTDNMDEPNDALWYVVGRLAEQYGRPEEARAAYLRMEKPEGPADTPTATYQLAKRRMAGMPGTQK
ncbi:MAG TPA: tetratricopeptide repeat protein, partial [Terriglobales bacterium]